MMEVDVILDAESPVVDVEVANRVVQEIKPVLHDDTLVGDGIDEPMGVNPAIIPDVSNLLTRDEILPLIPATATPDNQLADQGFVNSSIQTSTAHFRGNWETWADVPSDPELYPMDANGNCAPTPNDYLVVVADEQGGTWRYKYTGVWDEQGKDGWRAEYQVNETPLTAAQLAALNSGVTAQAVADISATKAEVAGKQDKLTAGENITIEDGVISATGGGASGDYLPLSGGTLTGSVMFDIPMQTYSKVSIIGSAKNSNVYFYAGSSNTDFPTYFGINGGFVVQGYLEPTYVGKSANKVKLAYIKKINNGADIEIPTTGGTMALKEDIETAFGDISTALTAILGE